MFEPDDPVHLVKRRIILSRLEVSLVVGFLVVLDKLFCLLARMDYIGVYSRRVLFGFRSQHIGHHDN